MKRIVFICFQFVTYAGFSQVLEGEIELGGFSLGQYRKAVHKQLGSAIQRIDTNDGWIYEFHTIKPDTSVYGLFKYAVWDTLRIYSIQLNGHYYDAMRPFKGLKLGDSKAQVEKILGNDHSRTDTIDNPKVFIYYYTNRNYSVEVDASGNLYGIQISGEIQANKPKEIIPSLDPFMRAVLTKNTDSLLTHLAPDIELFKGDKMLTFSGAARDEFKNEKSVMLNVLLGQHESLWSAFAKEKAEGTAELRFYAEKKASTTVYKFYKSKILEEIVFTPHAGKWKVWEIKFRL